MLQGETLQGEMLQGEMSLGETLFIPGTQTIKMPTLLQVMASFYLYEVVLSAALVKNRRFYCNSLLSGKKLLKFSSYYSNDVNLASFKKAPKNDRHLMWQLKV